ncbi:helix-turn-helix domain-containing protein [Desulfomonile tiedjei]
MPNRSEIAKIFGEVLQELRRKRGLSQEEFGFECELHRTYISLLERGKRIPSLTTIIQLAIVLKVSPSEIVRQVEARLGWPATNIFD